MTFSLFSLSTLIILTCLVMLTELIFFIVTSLSLMLVSFLCTRKLKVKVWFSTPGKLIAIFLSQIFIYFAIYYNYQDRTLPNTPEDLAILTSAYAFGLIWACNIYITAFGKKSTNYAK